MRLITNRSSGELGTLLALSLKKNGHSVIVCRGAGSTSEIAHLEKAGIRILPFDTTEELQSRLQEISCEQPVGAVFHVAAVSDYSLPGGGQGKISSEEGSLTVTLHPTPKLLPMMRGWFPHARIVGWKFEAGGTRDTALEAGQRQIARCATDACVVNGPSYGEGFGLILPSGTVTHRPNRESLCDLLADTFPKNFRG